MGSRIVKYLSLFALISAMVLGVLVIAAHLLVTPERIRDAVVPVLEQKLQRKVHLASVEVSLFSGVTLNRLAVVEPDSDALLVSADKVVMRYQVWPLLLQQVVFDEVRVEHPQLNIERLADGRFNLVFLPDEAEEQPPKVAAASLFSSTESADGIDLLISELLISQGEILFKDYSLGTPPHIYKMSQFDLRMDNLSLDRQSKVVFWGKFNGAPVDLEGSFSLGDKSFDLKLVTDQLDLIPLQPYYREYLKGRLDGLTLATDLRLRGGLDRPLLLNGSVSVRDLDLLLDGLKEYPLRGEKIDLGVDLTIDGGHTRLEVNTFTLNVDGIVAKAQGIVTGLDSEPAVDLNVTTPDWSLRQLVQKLPRRLSSELSNADPAGTLHGQWKLTGPVSLGKELLQRATIQLNAVQFTSDSWRPQIDGRIELTGKQFDAPQLVIRLGDNLFNLAIHSDHWQRSLPQFTVQLKSELFDATRPAGTTSLRERSTSETASASQGAASQATFRQPQEPGPIDVQAVIIGELGIEQLVLPGAKVYGLRGAFSLNNNMLNVDSLVGRIASGTFDLDAQVNLARQGFVYQGHAVVRDVDLDQLVSEFEPKHRGVLTGRGQIQGDFKGAGTQALRVQQNLSANGRFEIRDGKMEGTAVLKTLSELLALSEFSVFRFQKGTGTFNLPTGGQLNYTSLFDGSRARMESAGQVAFTKEIASTLDVYLAPAVVEEIGGGERLKKMILETDGTGRIPLRISGRYDRPKLTYNTTVLGEKAGQAVQQALQERVEERVGSDAAKVLAEPAAELINSALKELFSPGAKQ